MPLFLWRIIKILVVCRVNFIFSILYFQKKFKSIFSYLCCPGLSGSFALQICGNCGAARRKKGWVNMRKKFAAVNRVSILIMTLVSLTLFWRSGVEGCAEEDAQAAKEAEMLEEIGEAAFQMWSVGDEGKEREEERKGEVTEIADQAVPRAGIRTIRIESAKEGEGKREKIADQLAPLAAAMTAWTGVTVPVFIWFSVLSAPLFERRSAGKYRYIGRIRLKQEGGGYSACLTKRLLARAEIPVFQIKLPEKVRKNLKTGMIWIHCPGGRRIMATAGRTVHFTVEGD